MKSLACNLLCCPQVTCFVPNQKAFLINKKSTKITKELMRASFKVLPLERMAAGCCRR